MAAARIHARLQIMTAFVGREADVQVLRRRLPQQRLVTLTGVGGVGKTRVAVEAAGTVQRSFSDGVWTLALAQVTSITDALALVMPGATDTRMFVDALVDANALVVLDNCEHLIDDARDFVIDLLRTCPGVHVLATSRHRLAVPGEDVVVLAPMAVRPLGDNPPDTVVEASDAARFFLERAAHVTSADALQDLALVEDVCRLLQGIPLAMELAAARLTVLSLRGLRDRLDEPLRLLSESSFTDDPRHRTLATSVAWSYELCTPDEKLVWRALSTFSVPLATGALEYLVSNVLPEIDYPLDLIDALLRKSVLTRFDDGQPWFSLLVSLRDFGREQVRLLDEGDRMQQLRLDAALELAASVDQEWMSSRQVSLMAQLARAIPELRIAVEFALSREGGAEDVFDLILPIWRPLVEGYGKVIDVLSWLDRAFSLARVRDSRLADSAGLRAYLTGILHGVDASRPLFDEARALVREVGYTEFEVYLDAGQALLEPPSREAIAILERAVAIDLGERHLITRAGLRISLIVMHDQVGDVEVADRLMDEWIRETAASDERLEQMTVLGAAAASSLARGDADRALRLARQSLGLATDREPSINVMMSMETIAAAHGLRGDHRSAARLIGAADRIEASLGSQARVLSQVAVDRSAIETGARAALGDEGFEEHRNAGFVLRSRESWTIALGAPCPAEKERLAADSSLTRRERQIRALVAEGLTNADIARQLTISVRTVEWHVENVLMKLGVQRRAQIVAASSRQGDGTVQSR